MTRHPVAGGPEPIEARMARLEQLVSSQQDVIARQQERIEQLAGRQVAAPEHAALVAVAAPDLQRARPARSRRALLKLGGAAAVAGVAAAVAGNGAAHAHSANTIGVHGAATGAGNVGVEGDGTTNAIGVYGTSDGSFAMLAQSSSGTGLQASSSSGNGVVGNSTSNNGVVGNSTNAYGGTFQGGLAPLFLWPSTNPTPGPPSSGTHQKGELYVDIVGALWFCFSSAPGPSSWIRLTGPQAGTSGGTISYLSTPIRLLDARDGSTSGLVNRSPLAGNEVYSFFVAGLLGSGIPSGAQGLIANVTVLGPSGVGNLSLFPGGAPGPSVASMTFGQPGLFLANGVNVAIGSGGFINIQNQSNGTTPLVLDAVAYVS